MPDTDIAAALTALTGEVRELRADVALLLARGGPADPRLGAFLVAVFEFGRSSVWSTSELIDDARHASRRDLLAVVDGITAGCADPARSLGKFCRRHDGVTVDGLRLERVKRLWSVCADANG